MLIQIEPSVEEKVKFRTMKRLEDWKIVAHREYMVVVTQYMHSNFIFCTLHLAKSPIVFPFTQFVSCINSSYHTNEILRNWKIVHVNSSVLIGAESIHSSKQKIGNFWKFFLQVLNSVQMESKSTEKHNLSLQSCLVISSGVRKLIVHFCERFRSINFFAIHRSVFSKTAQGKNFATL